MTEELVWELFVQAGPVGTWPWRSCAWEALCNSADVQRVVKQACLSMQRVRGWYLVEGTLQQASSPYTHHHRTLPHAAHAAFPVPHPPACHAQ